MPPVLQIVEFFDVMNSEVVQRIPPHGDAILPFDGQLIVQDHQEAVFCREAMAYDVVGAGKYALNSDLLPLLQGGDPTLEERSAHVYFVGTQKFLDWKWAMPKPITWSDQKFGAVAIRGFGSFSFRVIDSTQFVTRLVMQQECCSASDLIASLRSIVVAVVTAELEAADLTLEVFARGFDQHAGSLHRTIAAQFAGVGIELLEFDMSVVLPPQVDEAMGRGQGVCANRSLQDFVQNAIADRVPGESARNVVRGVAEAAGWRLEDAEDVWRVTLPIGPLRTQKVRISFDRRDVSGNRLLNFSSTCGPASDQDAMALLRHNASTIHGAFAAERTESGEMIVVEANQLAETADAREITRAIAAIAWQADRAEEAMMSRNHG